MKKALKQRLKNVKLLILDVDGVMTNGQIILDHEGKEIKVFDVQDGFSIVVFHRMGYRTAIISARASAAVLARAGDLKIEKVYQDAIPKIKAYQQLLAEMNLKDHEVCFIGDDLPDGEILGKVGAAVAVSNAVKDVKSAAHYVTRRQGGQGAVREVIELILKTQSRWDEVLKIHKVKS